MKIAIPQTRINIFLTSLISTLAGTNYDVIIVNRIFKDIIVCCNKRNTGG
jgi:hypothetical protein